MNWQTWMGKNVFVQLKSGGHYSGEIIEVDDTLANAEITFITILVSRLNSKVTFVNTEIIKIVEETKEEQARKDAEWRTKVGLEKNG